MEKLSYLFASATGLVITTSLTYDLFDLLMKNHERGWSTADSTMFVLGSIIAGMGSVVTIDSAIDACKVKSNNPAHPQIHPSLND